MGAVYKQLQETMKVCGCRGGTAYWHYRVSLAVIVHGVHFFDLAIIIPSREQSSLQCAGVGSSLQKLSTL